MTRPRSEDYCLWGLTARDIELIYQAMAFALNNKPALYAPLTRGPLGKVRRAYQKVLNERARDRRQDGAGRCPSYVIMDDLEGPNGKATDRMPAK